MYIHTYLLSVAFLSNSVPEVFHQFFHHLKICTKCEYEINGDLTFNMYVEPDVRASNTQQEFK